MSVREEQLHEGFSDIVCGHCGTRVLVRKMSPEQTSVQWTGPASSCPMLGPAGCPALRDSIRAAVEAGVVPSGPR